MPTSILPTHPIVLLLVSAACSSCSKAEPTNAPSPEPQASVVASSPAPSTMPGAPEASAVVAASAPRFARGIELAKLLADYKDNELRADGQYKGKRLETSGTVGEVKKDLTGQVYVTVGTGEFLEVPVLQCFVAAGQEAEAASLSRGAKVTVRGDVDGLAVNVIAKECVINPVMQLCRRLQKELAAKKCSESEKTGDAIGIVIAEGSERTMSGFLACESASEQHSAEDVYAFKTAEWLKKPGKTLIGSPRALCFGLFWAKEAGKDMPFPEDVKAKVQALFDTL